jgi:hypothetical protein
MQIGDKGSMLVEGLRETLLFTVKSRETEGLHVEFDGSEVFTEWFRRTFSMVAAA